MAKTKTTKKYTLAELMPSATRELPVVHPKLGDLGFSITVRCHNASGVRRKALEAALTAQVAVRESKLIDKVDRLLEAENLAAETAAASVVGWPDDCAFGIYTPEACLALMKREGGDWLRALVNSYASVEGNFFQSVGD